MRILVIDDDSTTLMVAAMHLRARGHVVTVRTESIGATNAVRTIKPDVVLVDVGMPAIRGDSLVSIVRKAKIDTAIVLFSDRDEEELAHLAKTCGATGSIPKTEMEQLAQRLEAIVGKRA